MICIKIRCVECRKEYEQITTSHLKRCCGLTIKQYREKYPNVEMISEECREINSNSKKGRTFSENHKQNLRGPRPQISGENHPMWGKRGELSPFFGREYTDEHKQNISCGLKGRKFTGEHCKNISKNHKGFEGKKHTEETLIKMKKNHKGMKGKNHSNETKKQMRLSRIDEIKEKNGQIHPNFSLEACEFFKWLNKEFGLNGQHAENGGEFYVEELGYFVDYYEPNLNLVIEWDEEYHYDFDGNLKEKDIRRQKEIEEHLGCRFIRINANNIEDSIKDIFILIRDLKCVYKAG